MKIIKSVFLAIALLCSTNILIAKDHTSLPDSADLNEYIGKFKYETGPVEFLHFTVKEGVLVAFAEGYPETILHMKSTDIFEDKTYGAIFKFSRKDKKVNKVTLEVNGAELVATKVEE